VKILFLLSSSGYASSVASWHGGGAAPKQTVADPSFETFLNQADDTRSQHSQKHVSLILPFFRNKL
jgi:hypothetical protein